MARPTYNAEFSGAQTELNGCAVFDASALQRLVMWGDEVKIVRIDSDNYEKEVERVEIKIGCQKFTITEYFGELKIHAHSDVMIVKPCCANEIKLAALDT